MRLKAKSTRLTPTCPSSSRRRTRHMKSLRRREKRCASFAKRTRRKKTSIGRVRSSSAPIKRRKSKSSGKLAKRSATRAKKSASVGNWKTPPNLLKKKLLRAIRCWCTCPSSIRALLRRLRRRKKVRQRQRASPRRWTAWCFSSATKTKTTTCSPSALDITKSLRNKTVRRTKAMTMSACNCLSTLWVTLPRFQSVPCPRLRKCPAQWTPSRRRRKNS
mmetsp:Transcript_8801/g.19923  ORF Transcript_8801/g.19923 Transcript_8801/m.19923 type:complete len:218 (-) Transcript_8801:266-919(-)